jgi:hypothetical protein
VTRDEAEAVARVLTTADGDCMTCALALADEMAKVLPEHPWRELVLAADELDLDT